MNKKTLTILLLALLLVSVLFVVSLLLAGREPDSGPKFDLKSPGSQRVANWLSRPAKAEHLSVRSFSGTDCRLENNRITIRAGATCVYAVAVDKLWTRKLCLRLTSDQSEGQVSVVLVQQDALALVPEKTSDPLDIYGRQDQAPATLIILARGIASEEYAIEIVEK